MTGFLITNARVYRVIRENQDRGRLPRNERLLKSVVCRGALTSQKFVRGDLADTRDVMVRVARQAYEMSGIGPEELDGVESHDNFAVSELEHIVGTFCYAMKKR